MGAGEGEGPDAGALAAIVLGVMAWVSLVAAVFFADSALLFLFLGLALGAVALVLGLRARRDAAAVAGAAGAAGLALVYGAAVASMLMAAVYATGLLVVLVFLFLLMLLAGSGSVAFSGGGGGCSCPCEDCCDACMDCGDCCGDCGSCCECGGGCCCAALMVPAVGRHAPPAVPLGWRERLAHHPDAPEYAADVLRVRGVRLCIGCFVTYPVFLLASLALVLAPLASGIALVAGTLAASAQGVSSAGLARTRAVKLAVKSLLGAGLALYAHGVLAAAWPPLLRAAALALALALALLSAVPRARRMRRARGATCACASGTPREA